MKALITGVGGFVGGYLSGFLKEQGVEVWGTVLPNEKIGTSIRETVTVRTMDIMDKDTVLEVISECKPDYIFHLAAQSSVANSWKNPQLTMEVNINGTLNILDAVREINNKVKVLLIGSSEEYGLVKPEDIPISEKHPLQPTNPYAVSKMAQELLAQQYIRAYGLDIIFVRAFNHIGPKQSPTFVISDFAKRIAEMEKGLLEPILLVGNLEAKRDFTDVRDIVKGYYKLMLEGKTGEIYNIGAGNSYKIEELLKKLLKLSKTQIEIKVDSSRMRPSDMPIVQCDNRKITELTGWSPVYTIEETLKDVLSYWRNEYINN